MRLAGFYLIIVLLAAVFTGCSAVNQGISTAKIMLSWRGHPASALTASWGQPTADLSSVDFAFHSEYDQDILGSSGPPWKPDPPVERVLVYQTAAGDSFTDVTGTKSFAIGSANTTLYIGITASGKIIKSAIVTKQ